MAALHAIIALAGLLLPVIILPAFQQEISGARIVVIMVTVFYLTALVEILELMILRMCEK